MDVEKITPYADSEADKAEQVSRMFDSIAPSYDFMNSAMTMGIHRLWRRKALSMLSRVPHDDILDVATGTGDLAIAMAKKLDPLSVTGVDLSAGMVEIGRRKVQQLSLADTVSLGIGDCLMLPFTDGSFDAVTCAYGVRNFADLLGGYREMHRVLRPGGTALIIELSTPRGAITGGLYRLYSRHIIPAMGRVFTGDSTAYRYLPESIAAVPQGEQMTALMLEAGFAEANFLPLTFGACTIYTARK
ncbi:MAG: bifunctional demethylmenaquinone methyltransferase/2-methoxy-6-polyprenyl-1,4-benzoquinol methylase UbiE [Duncaniella sp.]|nr:bifunctional demethylmenaquinone methyltransferase/2-methoxy-6-polyprenyl-1,4-benzoquinol methylase UbiE [Duncaniella sp.]